jgi:hypothetical protein
VFDFALRLQASVSAAAGSVPYSPSAPVRATGRSCALLPCLRPAAVVRHPVANRSPQRRILLLLWHRTRVQSSCAAIAGAEEQALGRRPRRSRRRHCTARPRPRVRRPTPRVHALRRAAAVGGPAGFPFLRAQARGRSSPRSR